MDEIRERKIFGSLGVSSLSKHCMVIIDGSLYAWGHNHNGQLGDGTTTNSNKYKKIQNLENVVSVAWGFFHSMAITHNGDVYFWGDNGFGQLGDGTTLDSTTPKKLDTLKNITMIACSNDCNTIFLTSDGDVYCCGKNYKGQLGIGSINQLSTPQKINNLSNIISVSCGCQYSIAINDYGEVYSWGLNNHGQLGIGSTIRNKSTFPQKIKNFTNVTTIACGFQHVLALQCGEVYSWGENGYGQLGNGNTNNISTPQKIPNLVNIVAICCGYDHSMALTKNGDVYSWGFNYYGQLGVGSKTSTSIPSKVKITDKVSAIVGFGNNSLFVTINGNIFICGNNVDGQLCTSQEPYRISTVPQKLDLPNGNLQWSIPLQKTMEMAMLEILCVTHYYYLPKEIRILIIQAMFFNWRRN